MRVYLPATEARLRALLASGGLGASAERPVEAYAVTPALREHYASGDLEELEYAATVRAAAAALRLLAAEGGGAAPRRIVLAAELPDADVRTPPGGSVRGEAGEPAAVAVVATVPLAAVQAALVDGDEAADDVRSAVAALPAADAGDDDAAFVVAATEGHELLWYDASELGRLTTPTSSPR